MCQPAVWQAQSFCVTQHKTAFLSCLFPTQKCCASVSSCPDPRLDLLTHHECHTASPLRPQVWPGRTRPGRAPTSSNPQTQVPGITASGKPRYECVLCVLVRCVCILGIILVYCLSLCDAHSMFTRKKKTNLDDARDPSGVSSQRDPGIGRFANQKRRTWTMPGIPRA